MSFLKKLGSAVVNAGIYGSKQGIVNGILQATTNAYEDYILSVDAVGFHGGASISSLDMSNSVVVHANKIVTVNDLSNKSELVKSAKSGAYEIKTELSNKKIPDNESQTLADSLKLPEWGYDMFINERSSFQKGLGGPTGDPGYFYFKIFFDFSTHYGLFGGILNGSDAYDGSVNTAIKYLHMCKENYRQERLLDRINALEKFAKILSFINSQAPWFFKGISGLDKANIPQLKDFSQEKSIEIECLEDAIDMRLTTLMDLYRYAAYDDLHNKEIIPENLRKFDMSVMVYAAPLKYFHTAMASTTSSAGYKKFNSNNYAEMPSFKLYTFMNCEIALDSLGSMIPASMTNEKPFQMGKGRIKINYDNVVVHNMNEFNRILFGTTGIYYDEYYHYKDSDKEYELSSEHTQEERYKMLAKALDPSSKTHFDTTSNKFKEVIDASEAIAHTNLTKLTGLSLGNIYSYESKIGGDYWKYKLGREYNVNRSSIQDLGKNFLIKLFDSHYTPSSRLFKSYQTGEHISDNGWLPGYGEKAVRSQYWLDKVMVLKKRQEPLKSGYSQWVDTMTRRPSWSEVLDGITYNNYGPVLKKVMASSYAPGRNIAGEISKTGWIQGAKETAVETRYWKAKIEHLRRHKVLNVGSTQINNPVSKLRALQQATDTTQIDTKKELASGSAPGRIGRDLKPATPSLPSTATRKDELIGQLLEQGSRVS